MGGGVKGFGPASRHSPDPIHSMTIDYRLLATALIFFAIPVSPVSADSPPRQDSDFGKLIRVPDARVAQSPASPGSPESLPPDFRPSYLFPQFWTTWSIGALVRAIGVDSQHLWVGTTDGVIRYRRKDEAQTIFTARDGLLSNIILTIHPTGDDRKGPPGGAWIGTYGGGLSHFDGQSWKTYTPYGRGVTTAYGPDWKAYGPGEGLGDLWVYDIAYDPRGTLWVATWKGVSRFDGKSFKTFTTQDGLVDPWVYTLSPGPDGTFWFGTEGGVTYYDGRRWKSWTHRDGLGAAVSPEEDSPAIRYPAPVPHHQKEPKQVQTSNPNYVLSSVIDREGSIWFGTWGAGLARFDGKHWKNFTKKDGLPGNIINALTLDRDGVLWIGTDGGVSRYDGKRFTNYDRASGLLNDMVYAIVIDEQNHKWFGSYGYLTRFTGP